MCKKKLMNQLSMISTLIFNMAFSTSATSAELAYFYDGKPKQSIVLLHINLPEFDGRIISWSCTDGNKPGTCVAAGYKNHADYPSPILFLSSDGGLNWNEVTIQNLPKKGVFIFANCTKNVGNGTATCSALDEKNRVIVYSKNNFSIWKVVHFSYEMDPNGSRPVRTVCCVSTHKMDYCFAGGGLGEGNDSRAFSIQTQDGGMTWYPINFFSLGVINDSSCYDDLREVNAKFTFSYFDVIQGNILYHDVSTHNSGKSWNYE